MLLAALLAVLAFVLADGLGVLEPVGLERHRGWVLLVVVLLAALLARSRGFLQALAAATFLLLLLVVIVAQTSIVEPLVAPLVRRDPLPAEPLDAIMVLSAAVERDGRLSPPGHDRLVSGAALYERGIAPRLVLSRVRNGRRTSDEAQQRVLATLTRPVDLTVVDSVYATHDEALRVAALRPAVRRVALVTSPTHSRRACATFEGVGLAVTCLPSASRDLPLDSLTTPDRRLAAFRDWLYETIATAVYRMRGWID